MIAGASPKHRWSRYDKHAPHATERPTWERVLRSTEQWLVEHPAICLSGAVIMGVALGWLVKRR